MSVEIPGTQRELLPGSVYLGPCQETIALHIRLQPMNPVPDGPITRGDLPLYYADPEGLNVVMSYLVDGGAYVAAVDHKLRVIEGSASPRVAEALFGTSLGDYLVPETRESYRGRTGSLVVPEEVAEYIQSVSGLDTMAKTVHSIPYTQGTSQFLYPEDIMRVYNVPEDVDGTGQTVGIIGNGGGFSLSVLQNYWQSIGIFNFPTVTVVPTGGWVNNLNDGANTAELHMDIGAVGAFAPGAHIVVYAGPDVGTCISTAVHDGVNNPDIITMSLAIFNLPDANRTATEVDLSLAASLGITFVCPSGDWGSTFGERTDHNIVFNPALPDQPSYPQDSPNALVVGGTTLTTNSTGTQIVNETTWYTGTATSGTGWGSGGGVSKFFAKPSWQTVSTPNNSGTNFAGRAFPDIAGISNNIAGIYVDGTRGGWGGTSVASPMFAGILARVNQKVGHAVGFINNVLYAKQWAMRDIVNTQDTGHYPIGGAGWDIATGLGVPNVGLLIEAVAPGTTTHGSASASVLSTGSARLAIKGVNALFASAHLKSSGYALSHGAILPSGAMDDFSAWQPDLADPFMTRYINGLTTNGVTGWQRLWATSTVPQEFLDGSGNTIWKRASYVGVGDSYTSVPAGGYGLHSHVQLETWDTTFRTPTTLSGALPILYSADTTGVPATISVASVAANWPAPPFHLIISRGNADQELFLVNYIAGTNLTGRRGVASPMPAHSSGATVEIAELGLYESGRTIDVKIRANRTNYVKNPSFEASLAYVGTQNVSYSRTNGVATKAWGSYALGIQANSTADAYAMELLEINQSTQIAWAVWVLSPVGTWLDTRTMGLQEVSGSTFGRVIGSGATLMPIPANTWTRVDGAARVPFDWGSETALLLRPPSNSAGTAWDTGHPIYYDGLIVEEAQRAGDYFDGSFNSQDYMWETDDTGITHPHESRSYYYEGIHEKAYRVEKTVQQSIPYGASYHIRYGTTPIQ